jgi:hypothetical protein
MVGYYVVFNGKARGIYQSWHECSKHILGVRNAIYKKYSNYDQVVRDFQAAMRDVHPSHGAAPPLPYDPIPHDAFAPIIPPSDGNGKAGWWKKVLITSLVILVFGIWMKGGKTCTSDCPI